MRIPKRCPDESWSYARQQLLRHLLVSALERVHTLLFRGVGSGRAGRAGALPIITVVAIFINVILMLIKIIPGLLNLLLHALLLHALHAVACSCLPGPCARGA